VFYNNNDVMKTGAEEQTTTTTNVCENCSCPDDTSDGKTCGSESKRYSEFRFVLGEQNNSRVSLKLTR